MLQLYAAWAVIYGFVFITGVCIGSFLNVLVYRIPAGISFAKGRSFCPSCNHQLKAADLVPILSYAVLKGRCRYCKSRISIRYPLIELLGGVIAILCTVALGFSWQAAAAFVVLCILLVIALIDIDTMEIPDGLNIAMLVMAPVWIWLSQDINIMRSVIGFCAVSVPMIVMNLIVQDSFGGGDIKLCAAAGLMLGWQNMLVAIMIALLTGGGYGIWLLASGSKGRKEHFAFGPFLVLGIAVALLYGSKLISWYLGLFGLV